MATQKFTATSTPVRPPLWNQPPLAVDPPLGVQSFPLAEQAAQHAADLWWQSVPVTLAAWRDNRFDAFKMGMGYDAQELHARKRAFDIAFARRIAEIIAGTADRS